MMATIRDLQREIEAAKAIRASVLAVAPDDDDLARDMVEGETDLVEMIGRIVAHEGEDNLMLKAIDKYSDELAARRARVNGRIEFRRSLVAVAMDLAGLRSLETPTGTVSQRKVAPKAIISEEADIPTEYWEAGAPKLKKAEITAALREGKEIPGCTLSNGGTTISIRRG